MRSAVDRELVQRRRAEHDWRVDERVVVGRTIVMRRGTGGRQRGHAVAPAGRHLDAHLVGLTERVGIGQERWRPVQQRKFVADEVVADRHLAAVDPVAHDDRVDAGTLDPPAVLADLPDPERVAALRPGLHALQVPRVLPNEIRPGSPDGEHQLHVLASAARHRRLDLRVVRRGGREAQGVRDDVVRHEGSQTVNDDG